MTSPPRAFAYYEVKLHDFYVEGGEYEILAGKSSADICLAATVTIEASKPLPMTYCRDSILGDLPDTAEVQEIMKEILAIFDEVNSHVYGEDDSVAQQAITKEMREAEAFFRPIRQMISFSDGRITPEMVEAAVEKLNALQQA